MTIDEICDLFEKHVDEHGKFELVENKRSTRKDLHAFMLLDSLFPGSKNNMIASAEHDEIYLAPYGDSLEEKMTEELVIELRRCGCRIDNEGGLCMFV